MRKLSILLLNLLLIITYIFNMPVYAEEETDAEEIIIINYLVEGREEYYIETEEVFLADILSYETEKTENGNPIELASEDAFISTICSLISNMDNTTNKYSFNVTMENMTPNEYSNYLIERIRGSLSDYDYYYLNNISMAMLRVNYGNSNYKVTLSNINLNYMVTPAQKSEAEVAIDNLLNELNIYNASDYDKIKTLYDWLNQNITYDYSDSNDNGKYTAYNAIIKRSAVCQGYSHLMYRLLEKLNVGVRVGVGMDDPNSTETERLKLDHSWNIVNLEGQWYYFDVTQDYTLNGVDNYEMFLLGERHFTTIHAPRLPEGYTMSNDDYVNKLSFAQASTTLQEGSKTTVSVLASPKANRDYQTLTFSSSNPNIASVDNKGTITANKAGEATITVENASGKKATMKVTVTAAPQVAVTGISLDKTTISLYVNDVSTITPTVLPNNATNKTVTWSSSDASVATVNEKGTVTGKKAGTATITAKTVNGKTATCKVTVLQQVTSVTLNKSEITLNKGNSETLKATINPSNASNKTITWETSNSDIATVDVNGKVTGIKEGKVTITANAANNKSAKCTVNVIIPVTKISLNKTTLTLDVGKEEVLKATITPNNASDKNVTWSSSNTNVASVDNGKITAKKAGTATITAKSSNGKTATCTVTITQPVTGVKLNKTSTTLEVGKTETLTATVSPSDATNKAVTWKSANDKIAKVDANGKVTAVKAGTVTIMVTTNNGKTATCTVTVTQPSTGVKLNKTSTTLEVGKTETLTATVSPSDASDKTITWSSSNTNVAAVSNGKITAKKAGTATITAKSSNGKTATCTVTVKAASGGRTCNVPNDNISRFVTRLYDYCFNRCPDARGFNNWTTWLKTKEKTATDVVRDFFNSKEMNGLNLSDDEFIERCYLVMMDRPSDAAGKKSWKEKLENGVSRMYVVKGFIDSQEFTKVCNNYKVVKGSLTLTEARDKNYGITSFVARCYTKALGRNYDVNGLNNWCTKILNAPNVKQEAIKTASSGFFNSQEFKNKKLSNKEFIKVCYRTFLGREYDQAGLDSWLKKMEGGMTRDQVLNGFAGSQEFSKIMASYGIR